MPSLSFLHRVDYSLWLDTGFAFVQVLAFIAVVMGQLLANSSQSVNAVIFLVAIYLASVPDTRQNVPLKIQNRATGPRQLNLDNPLLTHRDHLTNSNIVQAHRLPTLKLIVIRPSIPSDARDSIASISH